MTTLPSRKKNRPVRRAGPARPPSLWERYRAARGPAMTALALLFFLGVLGMDLWPRNRLRYRVGQYVANDITARTEFQVLSQEKLQEAQQEARLTSPAVYRSTSLAEEAVAALTALPVLVRDANSPEAVDPKVRDRYGIQSQAELEAWQQFNDPNRASELEPALAELRRGLLDTAIIRAKDDEPQRGSQDAILISPTRTQTVRRRDVISLAETPRVREKLASAVAALAEPLRPAAVAMLGKLLEQTPTYRYDEEATKLQIASRVNEAREQCYVTYKPGDIVVPATARAHGAGEEGLPQAQKLLLEAEQKAYLASDHSQHPWHGRLRLLGRAVVLLLVTLLLCFYILRYAPTVVQNLWRALAVAVALLAMLGLDKLLDQLGANPNATALPVVAGALMLVIARDQRFSLAVGCTLAVLATMLLHADMAMLVVLVTAVAVCVIQLREIRTRTKLIQVTAVAAAAVFAVTWAQALARSVPPDFALADGLWGATATLLAGFLVQGVLPLMEKAFGTTTSMTLLEWCDPSRPLLQRLRTEAPGTYNHSLQLGSMCEAAAEAIGARGLLARVGAYYHDIGKMNKPEYFVENQAGGASKHSKLSPAMSLLIITGHVKDGLELAREYGLPEPLHEFIATHHGTTLVQYFYQAAAERRRTDLERAPDEAEFRYPGPRPQSKEAAILMLADVAESSVRAMPEPTLGRIESQVHAMVYRRLMDGQLDDCDLTLREVHQIELSLIKSLTGMYHSRIAYPAAPGTAAAPSEVASETKEQKEAKEPKEEKKQGAGA